MIPDQQAIVSGIKDMQARRRANEVAAIRAASKAKKAKAAADALAAEHLYWDNEAKRLNYFQDVEDARYHAVQDNKKPGDPWVNPEDFHIDPPTPAQWKLYSQAEKDAKGTKFP